MTLRHRINQVGSLISALKSIRPNKPEVLGKTPWDWLVFVVLPFGALIAVLTEIDSNRKATLRQLEASEEALQQSFEIQRQFNQQQILQDYLGQMTGLMSEKELANQSSEAPSAKAATSLTISILNLVSSPEKRAIFDFLYQSELITPFAPIIELSGADFSGINLSESSLNRSYKNEYSLPASKSTESEEDQPPGINFFGANLANSNLSSLDLTNTDLRNATLTKANLENTDMSEMNLDGIILNDANLKFTDFRNADFRNVIIDEVNFSETNLSGANLSRKSFVDLNFEHARLSSANLRLSNLFSNFDHANLDEADLRYSDFKSGWMLHDDSSFWPRIYQASFNHSSLSSTKMSNLDLSGISFRSANLSSADLRKTNLSGSNFDRASFDNANLREVKFDYAELYWTSFSQANLKDSNFAGANLLLTNFSDAKNLELQSLEGALLCRTQLPRNLKVSPYRDCFWLLFTRYKGWLFLLGLFLWWRRNKTINSEVKITIS